MGLMDFITEHNDRRRLEKELEKDRRDTIKQYLEEAKEYIEKGKETYNEEYERVNDLSQETRDNISDHNEWKRGISRRISQDISPILTDFKNFNIDSRIVIPKIAEIDSHKISSSSGVQLFNGCKFMNKQPSIFSILSTSGCTERDVEKARKQRNKAFDFSQEMYLKATELSNVRSRFNTINSFIVEEENQLNSLMNKLDKITEKLKRGMKNTEFTEKEANYMKCIHAIGNYIVEEMSTVFLDRDFNITEQYKKSFENIKKINGVLPESPQITDDSLLDGIKKILEGGIIVY